MKPSIWTDEKTNFLKKAWQSGKTYSEIGQALGTSRSSVSAKISRLGLQGLGGRTVLAKTVKPKPAKPVQPVARPKRISSSEYCWLVHRTGKYLHFTGLKLTSKEAYAWTGTKDQSENFFKLSGEYNRNDFHLEGRGRAPARVPFSRYGG